MSETCVKCGNEKCSPVCYHCYKGGEPIASPQAKAIDQMGQEAMADGIYEKVPQATRPEIERCAVCGFPWAETRDKGCRPGDCSLRPLPDRAYDVSCANREYAHFWGTRWSRRWDEPAAQPAAGTTPQGAMDVELYSNHKNAQAIARQYGLDPTEESFAKCVGAILYVTNLGLEVRDAWQERAEAVEALFLKTEGVLKLAEQKLAENGFIWEEGKGYVFDGKSEGTTPQGERLCTCKCTACIFVGTDYDHGQGHCGVKPNCQARAVAPIAPDSGISGRGEAAESEQNKAGLNASSGVSFITSSALDERPECKTTVTLGAVAPVETPDKDLP